MIPAAFEGKTKRGKRFAVQLDLYGVLACKGEVREYARGIGRDQNRRHPVNLSGEGAALLSPGVVGVPSFSGRDRRYADRATVVRGKSAAGKQPDKKARQDEKIDSCSGVMLIAVTTSHRQGETGLCNLKQGRSLAIS